MPVRLDWRMGASNESVAAGEPPPGRRRTMRSLVRALLSLGIWSTYFAALIAAGWLGFQLGRWRDTGSDFRAEIENRLQIESVAWQTADLDLYTSMLDPEADAAWREALVRAFVASAPRAVEATATEFERLSPELVRVEVEWTLPEATFREGRYYIFKAATWYLSQRAEP